MVTYHVVLSHFFHKIELILSMFWHSIYTFGLRAVR